MENEEKKVKNIQSIHRALDILEFLVDSGDGKKLSEITEHCGLNKTTAFHLIKTLEARNYIEQSPDSLKYKTGGKLFSMGLTAYKNINLNKIFQPYMEQLLNRFNETVSLYHYCRMSSGMKGLCISFMESDNPVHVSVSVGKQIPLARTAAGKLYLSALTEERLAETLGQEEADPSSSPLPEPEILKNQLDRIRQDRYCIERGEYEDGVVNIAVPVYKYSGRVMAAICISIPEQRASDELLNDMCRAMLPISEELSSLSL